MAKAKSVKTYCEPNYVNLTFDLNVPSDATSTADFYYYDEYSSTSDSHTVGDVLSGKVITTCYSSVSLYGYRFLGWYTDKTDGELVYFVPEEDNLTIYAHWEKLPQYTITLDFNGGTYTSSSTSTEPLTYTLYEGESLPNYTTLISNGDKVFAGWYTQAEGGDMVKTATGTMTVYAHYTNLLYKYWTETDSNYNTTVYLKFTFVPEDFGYTADDIKSVVVASKFNNWSQTQPPMTKENDGTYTCTYSCDYWDIGKYWYGYKFVVNSNTWLDWTNLKYGSDLSSDYRQEGGDKNFIIKEFYDYFKMMDWPLW